MLTEDYIKTKYEEIAPKITNYLFANGLEYNTSCDIVQETFIKIWKLRLTLNEDDSISGLAFKIAKNLRIDYFRKNKYSVYIPEIKDGDLGTTEIPNQDIEYIRKRLQDAISQLPEELATAYTLSQVGELSIKEIATTTEVSESLVKVRIHRAKKRLAELLVDLK